MSMTLDRNHIVLSKGHTSDTIVINHYSFIIQLIDLIGIVNYSGRNSKK